MVLAYHVILGAYGFWLPNDERGSWSDFVGAWELLRFGKATTTAERRSLAIAPFDPGRRAEARAALKYPSVTFDGVRARAIGRAFHSRARASNIVFHALSILPEHLHLVIARGRSDVEQVCNLLKGAATRQLGDEGIHPHREFVTPSGRFPKAFSRGQWKMFLNSMDDMRRAIAYVEDNPVKEGKARQTWACVQPLC